jgi:NADH-quinone oxidoreductase subunit H
MDGFFSTTPGLMLIIAAQSLAGDRLRDDFAAVSGLWRPQDLGRRADAAGPNVVGAFGLLQTVADALKYVVKEVVIPAGADRPVFMLAPMTSFVLAMIAWAVIPFNEGWVCPISTSPSSMSSPSPRWRSTASSWAAGRRTRNTRSSARCARRRR